MRGIMWTLHSTTWMEFVYVRDIYICLGSVFDLTPCSTSVGFAFGMAMEGSSTRLQFDVKGSASRGVEPEGSHIHTDRVVGQ